MICVQCKQPCDRVVEGVCPACADKNYAEELSPFDKRCADALADEVDVLVQRGVIDSRSPAADALLDYRNPPSTPRSDRITHLEAWFAEIRNLLEKIRDWRDSRWNADGDRPPSPPACLLGIDAAIGLDAGAPLIQRLKTLEMERDSAGDHYERIKPLYDNVRNAFCAKSEEATALRKELLALQKVRDRVQKSMTEPLAAEPCATHGKLLGECAPCLRDLLLRSWRPS